MKPPTARVSPTWDVSRVLAVLAEWDPALDIGLPTLSKKVAFVLVICSAKCVSDLTLFSVDKSLCFFFGDSSVVLQAHFGAKTDRPSHMSPPTRLKSVRTAACVQLVTYRSTSRGLRCCVKGTRSCSHRHNPLTGL